MRAESRQYIVKAFRAVACVVLLLAAASCSLHKPAEVVSPPIPVPETFHETDAAEKAQPSPDRWWTAFEDEHLDGLVERALEDNFTLRGAWARVSAAEAAARIAGSRLAPTVDLDAGLSKGHAAVSSSAGSVKVRSEQKSFVPSIAYEVDLWGRLKSLTTAAELDTDASRADVDSAAMTLAAGVARAYFGSVEQRAREQLIREQLKTNETFLELVKLRAGQGMASAVDVYQQRQQVAGSNAQLPLTQAGLRLAEHQVAVLLGKAPGDDLTGKRNEMVDLPAPPEAGVPATLLKRRPDIRAAELRIIAVDNRIAAAVADKFPTVRLSAMLPFQAGRTGDVFKYFVWSLGAGASAPIFDGGRRDAEIDRNRALLAERISRYGDVLLTALREVEDALSSERHNREYLERLADQVRISRETLRESRARYLGGQSDYLPVLTALRDVQRLEMTYLIQRFRLVAFRIDLYRALGGSWTDDLTPPDTDRADGGGPSTDIAP